MARHEFWTHGVDAVVEFPNRASEIRHAGFGTVVTQAANTDNWFHIAVPSNFFGHLLEGAFHREMRLRAVVNENARIDRIHIEHDGTLIDARTVSFTDRIVDETFQTADMRLRVGGLVLCVHVSFLTGPPLGRITLRSGGVVLLSD